MYHCIKTEKGTTNPTILTHNSHYTNAETHIWKNITYRERHYLAVARSQEGQTDERGETRPAWREYTACQDMLNVSFFFLNYAGEMCAISLREREITKGEGRVEDTCFLGKHEYLQSRLNKN